mmetsp:Transcript_34070/g.45560  ORF Transcript_34070/g.45560 Transcript_34070/m.45560 type:complete len:138 (+) Transcript_34070:335-748(+)
MTILLAPFCMTLWSASTTVFSLLESRAAVGSSNNKTSGDRISARAIATLCLCPPDNVLPPSPTLVSNSKPKSFLSSPVTGKPANSKASATRTLIPSSCSTSFSSYGNPYKTFSINVVGNKCGSCSTTTTLRDISFRV